MGTEEADAQSEYEKVSQENAVTKTLKDQDIKYKTQEFKARDSTVAEQSGDRETAQTELSAVLDFYSKIKRRRRTTRSASADVRPRSMASRRLCRSCKTRRQLPRSIACVELSKEHAQSLLLK